MPNQVVRGRRPLELESGRTAVTGPKGLLNSIVVVVGSTGPEDPGAGRRQLPVSTCLGWSSGSRLSFSPFSYGNEGKRLT